MLNIPMAGASGTRVVLTKLARRPNSTILRRTRDEITLMSVITSISAPCTNSRLERAKKWILAARVMLYSVAGKSAVYSMPEAESRSKYSLSAPTWLSSVNWQRDVQTGPAEHSQMVLSRICRHLDQHFRHCLQDSSRW